MDKDNGLPFLPRESDEELPRELVQRIEALYAATPGAGEPQIQRCVDAVARNIGRGLPKPFNIRARWWWGGAAAAALVLAVSMRTGFPGRNSDIQDTLTTASAKRGDNGQVQFLLRLPAGASKVSVVGDWNQWDAQATPMTPGKGKDAWSANVSLAPGRHVYAYVINGERWLIDPLAPQADGGYGPANALVVDGAF